MLQDHIMDVFGQKVGWFWGNAGLALGKPRDVARGGLPICFIWILHAKTTRAQVFLLGGVLGFSVG